MLSIVVDKIRTSFEEKVCGKQFSTIAASTGLKRGFSVNNQPNPGISADDDPVFSTVKMTNPEIVQSGV